MVKVRNHRKGSLNLRFGVKLLPGDNDVAPDAWTKCKVDPITSHYLQVQDIEVIVSDSQVPTAKAPTAAPPVVVGVEALPAVPAPVKEPESPAEDEQDTEDEPTNQNGETVGSHDDVAKMKAKDVISMVDGLTEEMVLKNLLMTEQRPTVRAAIERRLQELKDQ